MNSENEKTGNSGSMRADTMSVHHCLPTQCLPLSLIGGRLSINICWISEYLFVEQTEECLEGNNLFGQR